jgi:hypothetical protein
MKHFIASLLNTTRTQVFGQKGQPRIWTAYTARGKVVIIDGDRVIQVIDPKKQKVPR